jgi:hypothetical protein
MSGHFRQAVQRKGSFLQTVKAVAWSFFGVRKNVDYEKDVTQLHTRGHCRCVGCFAFGCVVIVGCELGIGQWSSRLMSVSTKTHDSDEFTGFEMNFQRYFNYYFRYVSGEKSCRP